jgi:putative ABC transport system ATP-binding protein
MPAPVVEATGINLHLKSGGEPLHILRDVGLSLAPGEVAAIVGPSGSGKSTLLGLLAGLDSPSTGRIVIDEAEITAMSEDALARFRGTIRIDGTEIADKSEDQLAIFRRRSLGILFQNFHLVPSMTALENVALTLEIAEAGRPWKAIRDRAAAALSEVGLSERLTHLPNALSGGEQQRVGLARALVGEPKLLLADEPTGNLDQETGERMIELMFHLARERGTSILLITHDPSLAARADRLLHMNQGRLTTDMVAA